MAKNCSSSSGVTSLVMRASVARMRRESSPSCTAKALGVKHQLVQPGVIGNRLPQKKAVFFHQLQYAGGRGAADVEFSLHVPLEHVTVLVAVQEGR